MSSGPLGHAGQRVDGSHSPPPYPPGTNAACVLATHHPSHPIGGVFILNRVLRALSAAAVLLAAGCGEGRGPVGLSANAAHFDTRIALHGASLRARGHNCSGIYGHWSVRLEVGGAVKGSGDTSFTLAPGKEATAPVSFRIRSGLLSGRATGLMRVASERNALVVRGSVQVKVPLGTVSRTIGERIPLERGPTPQCGL